MGKAPLVGGYRLGDLLRPDTNRATWRAVDVQSGRAAIACLVPREIARATEKRRTLTHTALARVLEVLRSERSPRGGEARAHALVVLDAEVGKTLDEIVTLRGALGPRDAVRVVATVGDALAAIHESGAVHGGVAPDAIEVASPPSRGARLSLRGVHDGAIAFASPERIADGSMSPRDDAWALAATLYFALSGAPPFPGTTPKAILAEVLRGPPLQLSLDAAGAGDLQKILDRAFARVPSQRQPAVADLRDDLRLWLAFHEEEQDDEPDEDTTVAHASALDAARRLVAARVEKPAPSVPGARTFQDLARTVSDSVGESSPS